MKKLIFITFTIFMLQALASAQTAFSESTPYQPKSPPKSGKKKSDKTQSAPTPTPSSGGMEQVTIPISVFDKSGMPIADLSASEVKIFVDDNEIAVESFAKETEPLHLVLMIDTSISTKVKLEKIREDALRLVDALPSSTKITVVDFNRELNIRSRATDVKAETRDAIQKAKEGDGTSLYSAMVTVLQKVFPQFPGRKALVLLTDGVDTTSQKATYFSSLVDVEKAGVAIYPVIYDTEGDAPNANNIMLPDPVRVILAQRGGLGSAVDRAHEYKIGRSYLTDLTAASGGRLYRGDKFDLGAKHLSRELLGKYYATISVPKKGPVSRKIKVRVARPGLTVHARGSFVEN